MTPSSSATPAAGETNSPNLPISHEVLTGLRPLCRTVDLASYSVKSLDPIRLAGAAKGSGGLCGSSFLNRVFAKYLETKLKGYTGGWDDVWLRNSVDYFERQIKPAFTGNDKDCFPIMVHGLRDSLRHGIKGSNLYLHGKELRENVFDKVVMKVQALVRDQIANTKGAKAILMAGGFGQSSYLKHQLERLPDVQANNIMVHKIDHRQVKEKDPPMVGHFSNGDGSNVQ